MKTISSLLFVGLASISSAWSETWIPPQLFVAPASLAVSVPQGGSVTNLLGVSSDGATLVVYPSSSAPWMSVGPQYVMAESGPQGTGIISVVFQAGVLPAGSYTGRVMLAADGASNAPLIVSCVLMVTPLPRVLTVFPTNRSVVIVGGDTSPANASIMVRNAGNGSMAFSVASDVNWISPSTSSGVSTGNLVQVSMSISNLIYGTYTGRVTVSTADSTVNAPWVIPVVASYRPPVPPMSLSTQRVAVSAMQEGSGTDAPFEVLNGNPNFGSFDFTVTCYESWLTASPISGTCNPLSYINLSMNPVGLAPGLHRGAAIVQQTGTESSLVVSVDFTVEPAPYILACSGVWTASVPVGSVVTQYVRVWNAGNGDMAYTFAQLPDWFSPQTDTGYLNPGQTNTHLFFWSGPSIAEGSYATTILLSSGYYPAPNSPMTIPIKLDVVAKLSVSSNRFKPKVAFSGGLTSLPLRVWNSGSENPVTYMMTNFGGAFTLSANQGISAGATNEVFLLVDPQNLRAGVHRGWVDIAVVGGFKDRVNVDVIVNPTNVVYEEAIVFCIFEGGEWDIWQIRPDGEGARPLVAREGHQTMPRISPDGNYLLFLEESTLIARRLVIRDLQTGAEAYLPPRENPRWAGDSSTVLGVLKREGNASSIQAYLPSGGWTNLYHSPKTIELFGSSAEGWLYFSEYAANEYDAILYRRLPGEDFFGFKSHNWEMIPQNGMTKRQGSISHDGSSLVFQNAGNSRLHFFDTELMHRTNMVQTDFADDQRWPALSPESDHAAFVSFKGASVVLQVTATNQTAVKYFPMTNVVTIFSVPNPSHLAYVDWGRLAQSPNRLYVSPLVVTSTAYAGSSYPEASFTVNGSVDKTTHYAVIAGGELMWSDKPQGGVSDGEADTVTLIAGPRTAEEGVYTQQFQVVANAYNSPLTVEWVLTRTRRPSNLKPVPIEQVSRVLNLTNVTFKPLAIVGDGGGPAEYTLACNQPWVFFDLPQGTVTGSEYMVQMGFNSSNLIAGFHTAVVTFVSGSTTQTFETVFETYTNRPGPPQLAISTNVIRATTTQYLNPSSVTFHVWNSGGNGSGDAEPLRYIVKNPQYSAYYKLSPPPSDTDTDYFTSYGERDAFELRFTLATHSPQTINDFIEIKKEGDAAFTKINIYVTINPPGRYAVNVDNASGFPLHSDPPPGSDGLYDAKTVVRLWVEPTPGREVNEWSGDVQSVSTQVQLTVIGHHQVRVTSREKMLLGGFVLDARTGGRISLATVWLDYGGSMQVARTDTNGYYQIRPSAEAFKVNATSPGYLGSPLQEIVFTSNRTRQVDFSLSPTIFGICDWSTPAATAFITVNYFLNDQIDTVHRVDMDISFDQGATWKTPPGYPAYFTGSVACDVRATQGKRTMLWNIAQTYPDYVRSNVLIRLRSDDQYVVSPPFSMDTRLASSPILTIYHDQNSNFYYDPGEGLAGAEVYIGGRTTNHFRGLTDSNGRFMASQTVKVGDTIFARKMIHTQHSTKFPHAPVDSTLYKLWLDTDEGTISDTDLNSWDGIWKSWTFSQSDIWDIRSGLSLDIPAGHALFEWNFVIDSDNSDPFFLANLDQGIIAASKYLYKITDGQMKLGKVYVRSDGQVLLFPDCWIRSEYDGASAGFDGINHPADKIKIAYYEMDLTNGTADADLTHSDAWGRTFVHEMGHYAFAFWDEYVSHLWGSGEFDAYRATHRDVYPWNYGVMQGSDPEVAMSSQNDYPPDITLFYPPGYTSIPDFDGRIYQTAQLARSMESCWASFKKRYQRDYSGHSVFIAAQKSGQFVKGAPTFPDRISSREIPQPYSVCQIRHNDDDFSPKARRMAEFDSGPSGPVQLTVLRNGQPVPAAQVGTHRADRIPFAYVGRTARDGRISLASLKTDDRIIVNHDGIRAEHLLVASEIGGEVTLSLSKPSTRNNGSPGTLAMIVSGNYDASGNYLLTLAPAVTLTGAPSVIVCANDVVTNAVVMTAIGGTPARWQGVIPMTDVFELTVDISAAATNGATFNTFDRGTLIPVKTMEYISGSLVTPSPYLQARETDGLIWRQEQGPVPLPPPGQLIPPLVHFALADQSTLSSQDFALLYLEYEGSLTPDVDETTIGLYRWDVDMQTWQMVPYQLNLSTRSVEARLVHAGPYALFAQSTADTNAPAAITNLMASANPGNAAQVILTWTATGDDGLAGTAVAYELLLSGNPITAETVGAAEKRPLLLVPAIAGTPEHYEFEPGPESAIYIALRARDKAGNVSPLSNITSARTTRPVEEGQIFPAQYLATMALRGYPDLNPDGDEDGDGESNWDEFLRRTDPLNRDTDGDGMPDGFEDEHGLNPLDASDAAGDLDNDGIPNGEEEAIGSDPTRASTVEDGIPDGWKHRYGLDLIGDLDLDDDEDVDTFSTKQEFIADTNPRDDESFLHINDVQLLPGGMTIFLNASTQRVFTVDATTHLSDPGVWDTLVLQVPGYGTSTPITLFTTNHVRQFRIKAELP